MSEAFASKYSDNQRAAVVAAFVDAGTSAPTIVDLAAAGKLEHEGEPLDPFKMPASTVRSLARDARRRRSGEMRSDLANAAPADALEDLRRRLVSAIDHEMRQIERRQKAGEVVKGEELRQLARACWELAARTGPAESRPPAPGAKVNGARDGGTTRGGLAGVLMADHLAGGLPPAWPAPPITAPSVSDTRDTPEEATPDDDRSPAALAREMVAQFEAGEEIQRDGAWPTRSGRVPAAAADAPTRIVEPNGFDHSRLPAEDVSAIERSERGAGG